jgi:hypothetical protein
MGSLTIDFKKPNGEFNGTEIYRLEQDKRDYQQAEVTALRKMFGFASDEETVAAALRLMMLATRDPQNARKIALLDENNHPLAVCTLDQPKK